MTSGGLVLDHYPLVASFVDRVPPTVSITAPPEGSIVATASTIVQGSSSDAGGDGVARVEVRVNGGAWQPCLGTTSWTASVALARGANFIEARAWDYGGSPSGIAAVNISFEPSVIIVDPKDSAVIAQATFVVMGTATIATVVRVQVDGGAWQDASGTSVWSRIVGPLADGPHVIRAPDLTVRVPAEGQTIAGTIGLSGTATAGASVLLRIDGGPWANLGLAGADGAWSFSWNATGLADGGHLLEFKAAKDGRESAVAARHVVVQNATAGPTPGVLSSNLVAVFLLSAAAIVVALLLLRRRRRTAAIPPDRSREGRGA